MSFSIKNKKPRRPRKLVSDINITPFVDVLLVLLIIFMITSPMLTGSVDVDLPEGDSEQIQEKKEPAIVTINSNGKIFFQDEEIKLSLINEELPKILNNNLQQKIYVKADKKIDYGRVMDVIKRINQAGFKKVILVTELTQ